MKRPLVILGILGAVAANARAEEVTVRTAVRNDELVSWNLNCPSGSWGDAFTAYVDQLTAVMSDDEIKQLGLLIDDFERVVGIQIASETTYDEILENTDDFGDEVHVLEETIFAQATGPATGAGAKLCAVAAHARSLPPVGEVTVHTALENDELIKWNLDCPSGPWGEAFTADIDQLATRLSGDEIEQLGLLIDDFERIVGIQIASETTYDEIFENTDDFRDDTQILEETILAQATGPATGVGAKLCSVAAQASRLPPVGEVTVHTALENDELVNWNLDCPIG